MRSIISILLFIISLHCYAQNDSIRIKHRHYPSISSSYSYGNIMRSNDFVRGDNLMGKPMEHFQSTSLKIIWQDPGYTDWQKIYHAPYYGFGFSYSDLFNPTEVGYPVSGYGILGIPVKRWEKLELFSEFQFGIATNWKNYHPINNPRNFSIGGHLTIHVTGGFTAFYPLSKRFDLGLGIGFIHFSNGGFERPNNGFNIYTPSLEMKYHIFDRPDTRKIKFNGRLPRSNDLFLMAGYGDYQRSEAELDSNYYAVGGLSAIYFTQFSNVFRLGYGTDINYLWGLNALPNGQMGPEKLQNLTLGFILQPEFIIHRVTLVSGIGVYAIHHKYGSFNRAYQRLGVRYEFLKNLTFGMNIRSTYFSNAEFLEFNLGYRIRWMK
ncbi:MAG: acyloxyacyl hydrolase [Bacteroidales bacterium]|nr:acyloxyacyl hydrolase [Bacteroidales bacterium]